jgi:hypothetical protein
MASFHKVLQCHKKMMGEDQEFHPHSIEVNIGDNVVTIKNSRDLKWKDILAKAKDFAEGDVKAQCAAFKGWMDEKKWAGKSKATDALVAAKKPKLVDAGTLFKPVKYTPIEQAFEAMAPSETALAVHKGRAPSATVHQEAASSETAMATHKGRAAPSATVHQEAASSETAMATQMMMMQHMMGSMQQMMLTAQSSNILVLQDEAKKAYINDNKEKIIKEAARQLIKKNATGIREAAILEYIEQHRDDKEFRKEAAKEYARLVNEDYYNDDLEDDDDEEEEEEDE